MVPWRGVNLRVRLLLVVVLAVLPMVGLALVMAAEQRRLKTVDVQAHALQLVRVIANRHELLIEGTRQLLTSLAHVPEAHGGDPAACRALFATLLRGYPLYTNLGTLQPDGTTFCSALPVPAPINSSRFTYFQRVIATRDFVMGDFQIGLLTGKPIVLFGYPVLDATQTLQAVLFAALDLTWLSHFATTVQMPSGVSLTVVDHQGTILACWPDPQRWIGQAAQDAPLVKRMFAHGDEGTTIAQGLDGLPRLYAFTRLRGASPSVDAYVSLGVPTAVVFAEANRLLTYQLLWLGLVLVVGFGVTWTIGNRSIVRRVQALVQATQRLAAGDLRARTGVPYRLGELGQLARAFDAMAETLSLRQAAALQATEALRQQRDEIQLLSQQLWHAAKLATMGELAASIAHELNNPLATVCVRVEALLAQAAAGSAQQRALAVIDQEVERMGALVANLLQFSRRGEPQISVLNVHDELEQTLALMQAHLRTHRIRVEWQCAPDVPLLQADRQQLRQVFLNLLTNASDAMPDGGTLTVHTAAGSLERAAPAVVIEVRDTGVGIAPDVMPNVLEPFFTTKPAGQGTGLGLPICRRIVHEHHGTFTIDSVVGAGTTVRLVLPVTSESTSACVRTAGSESDREGGAA